MSTLDINDKAPSFTLPANDGKTLSLSDYKGRYVVLYFYPRDDTPGCTKEAIAFTQHKAAFDSLGADIIGVSKDTPAKHDKFISKHELDIDLGSDEIGETLERYGVWVEKKNYGKIYMGIVRTTLLIDPKGKVVHIWNKVRVKNHVENVLSTLKSLTDV